MSDAVKLVSGTVRRRLLRDGAGALGEPDWHLLRVSRLLNAAERGALGRLLGEQLAAMRGAIEGHLLEFAARHQRRVVTAE